MANETYPIPAGKVEATIEIKRSQFIAIVEPAANLETFKSKLAEIKEQYPDATHHCYAYQLGPPGSSRQVGCSDDGEPHGTAGKPMLNILMHQNVGELMAVVIRYYGGVKLGTGGLVRAYSDALLAALEDLPTRERVDWTYFDLRFSYDLQSDIENALQAFKSEILKKEFQADVSIHCRCPSSEAQAMKHKINHLSRGQAVILML